ncbi:MAG: hypothetical protein A2169_09630 [Deltaproteobacteria bacterium RBG_13_47_9]|nr:MAG: hypothetical protein A2169_09630 [Deltaproteobacteria bacterium RBG_13_47_9]
MLIMMFISLSIPVGSGSIVIANPPASPEYLIKAAYLYNFTKFVEWPPEAFEDDFSPINLFILGADPFGEALDSIKNRTVQGRRLNIKYVNHIEEVSGCHILFISASEKENLRSILRILKNSTILTISETENFSKRGGIINFIQVENKIHFEINPDAAQQGKLKISSQLLRLAKIVSSESR